MINNNNNHEILYAGFLVRLWAYIIDCIIVGCAMLIIRIPMFIISKIFPDLFLFRNILFKFDIVDIAIYIISAAYFIIMTYYYGATLGKKAMKIKVVKENEDRLLIIDIIYRETIGRYLSQIILCIGYLLVAIDSRKRGLHDMLCDTIVVYDINLNSMEQKYVDMNVQKDKSAINNDNVIETTIVEENKTDEDI